MMLYYLTYCTNKFNKELPISPSYTYDTSFMSKFLINILK